jgi:hypothetical protein
MGFASGQCRRSQLECGSRDAPRRLFKHGSPSISRHVVSANAQSPKDQGQVLWRLHWTRGRFSAPAANVYLRRHIEVPVDVPRIVLVLRCPRRQILRPWLPMPDRCLKASLIDRVTLLCVDSGADRAACNRDSRGDSGGTRHAEWILHRALETRSSHSKTPIPSHHCQGCIRTKNNMAARWMPVEPELLDLDRGGDEGRAHKSAVEQCVPLPAKGRHRHTTSGLRLFSGDLPRPCRSFTGFGTRRMIPKQTAAIEALGSTALTICTQVVASIPPNAT